MAIKKNNFSFIQILAGVDDSLLADLGLTRDLSAYTYLTEGSSNNYSSTCEQQEKEKSKFDLMFKALQACNICDDKRMVKQNYF